MMTSLCFVLCFFVLCTLLSWRIAIIHSTIETTYQVLSTKNKVQSSKLKNKSLTTYDRPDVPGLQPQMFHDTSRKPCRAQSTHLQQWPDRLLIQQPGPQVLPAYRLASGVTI